MLEILVGFQFCKLISQKPILLNCNRFETRPNHHQNSTEPRIASIQWKFIQRYSPDTIYFTRLVWRSGGRPLESCRRATSRCGLFSLNSSPITYRRVPESLILDALSRIATPGILYSIRVSQYVSSECLASDAHKHREKPASLEVSTSLFSFFSSRNLRVVSYESYRDSFHKFAHTVLLLCGTHSHCAVTERIQRCPADCIHL